MNLKCLSGMGIHSDTFYDDIMSGYNLFSLDFSAQELLFLLMDKNGGDEQPYSMTTLVNIVNRNETGNFNVQIVNHFVNTFVRLLRGAGTYRDYLYINNFLGKAGINDTYSFTRLVSAYVHNIENRERLDNIYRNIAESDLRTELKSCFENSNLSLLKEDNIYNRTYEGYLEAVRSNAEFIMSLSSVSFDRHAMELELTKSKFLMELLKINNAAYGRNLQNGSEVQKAGSVYMDTNELYAANITADMYINPFIAISKDMEYGIAGADRYFNGDLQKIFAGAVCEIIKRVYQNGVQEYISAENENTENKYIEKYIGNKYIENKHIGNGHTDYAAGTADIGNHHGTELFQLENTDIDMADVVNNVYKLMREKFAYVQNYSAYIGAVKADYVESLKSGNIVYDVTETVYSHGKNDIRYNTDGDTENNIENYVENNIDENSEKASPVINKISETGSDIQYNSYSYENEKLYKNNTENYMGSPDGDRGGNINNNFENDIRTNIENGINIKNSIENNIENNSNSDKKNVINVSERKSSTTENVFMDSIDADIKRIEHVRQYIDIAEQFIAAEKIYMQNHGDDKGQAAKSTIQNNILQQNDILQQNNISLQNDTQQQNDASRQNADTQAADDDGAVMFHVDNQVELQRLEELLSFEFNRTGKTNIFHGNTKTENKIVNAVDLQNVERENISRNIESQNISGKNETILEHLENTNIADDNTSVQYADKKTTDSEIQNTSQRYLNLQSFAETMGKIIKAQIVYAQVGQAQIMHTRIADVQNVHTQVMHTQPANKYLDISNSNNINYSFPSEDMRLENIQNINSEGAHSGNAQNINPEALHSENTQNAIPEIIYSGDTQNAGSGNIQSVNSEAIGSETISLETTQAISSQNLHSESIQNISSENMYSGVTYSENTQNTGSENINFTNIQNIYPENSEADIYMSYLTGNRQPSATAEVLPGISQSNVVLSFPGGDAQESSDTGMYNAQQMNSTTVRNVSNESLTRSYSSNISNATDISNYGYSDRTSGSRTRQQEMDYESGMERKISNVIANQINNISERVYGQLERRLENERKRRGI